MSLPRIAAEIWIKAHIRRCHGAGIFATLIRRGDATAGAVLLKLNNLNGEFFVLSRALDGQGSQYWLKAMGPAPVSETEAEAYIERQLKYDPDLWVLEIEDREGRHLFDEPVRN